MFILLCTHKTYNLATQEKNVKDILTVFNEIVGITEEDTNNNYEDNAQTIQQIQNNLDYLEREMKNNNDVQNNINTNLKMIHNLVDDVKKSLQEQIESLNQELDGYDEDSENNGDNISSIKNKVDTLNEQIDKLNDYYKQLPGYLNKNKGQIFISIMCYVFIPIYTVVFVTDILMFLFYTCNFF
jgi:chromosome segregation ATPase